MGERREERAMEQGGKVEVLEGTVLKVKHKNEETLWAIQACRGGLSMPQNWRIAGSKHQG